MSESSTLYSTVKLVTRDKHLIMKNTYTNKLNALTLGLVLFLMPTLMLANWTANADPITGSDTQTDLEFVLGSVNDSEVPQLRMSEIDIALDAQDYFASATALSQTQLDPNDVRFVWTYTKTGVATKFRIKVMKALQPGTSLLISSRSLSGVSKLTEVDSDALILNFGASYPCGTVFVFDKNGSKWSYADASGDAPGSLLQKGAFEPGGNGSAMFAYQYEGLASTGEGVESRDADQALVGNVTIGKESDWEVDCAVMVEHTNEGPEASSLMGMRMDTTCPYTYMDGSFCDDCTACPDTLISPNPDVTASCGDLRILLVLDESGSISPGEGDEVADGVNTFVSGLNCQGVELAMVEFGTLAQFVLDTAGGYQSVTNAVDTAVQDYFLGNTNSLLAQSGDAEYLDNSTDNGVGTNYTNYQAALLAADDFGSTYGQPDLLIFFTDGQPTRVYLNTDVPDYGLGGQGLNGCGGIGVLEAAEYGNASIVANKLKCAGVHMFVGAVSTSSISVAIPAISGNTQFENGVNTILTADYAIGEFDQLISGFATFVSELCPFDTEIQAQDLCPGASNAVIGVAIPEVLTDPDYSWRLYKDEILQSNGTDDTTFLVLGGLSAGNYRVELDLVGEGGCIRTETLLDSIVAGADSTVITGTTLSVPTCDDEAAGSAKVTVTQGVSPYIYELKIGDSIVLGPTVSAADTNTATGLNPGTYLWKVIDANACNIDSFEFTLDEPVGCCEPVCPPDTVIDCGTPLTAEFTGYPTNLDGCNIDSVDLISEGPCPDVLLILRNWRDDGEIFCTQIILVQDTTAPVAPMAPADTTVQCSEDVPTGMDLSAVDGCLGIVTVSPEDDQTEPDCPNDYVITRSWTFTDSCGNSTVITQTITVKDTIAPVPPAAPADTTIECLSDLFPQAPLIAVDNCDGNVGGTPQTQDTTDNGCADYTIYRSWLFTDDCGNSSTVGYTITVKDTTAPMAPDAPDDEAVACASQIPIIQPLLATDNCGGQFPGLVSTVIIDSSCINDFVMVRTWTFTDTCGNSSSVTQSTLR